MLKNMEKETEERSATKMKRCISDNGGFNSKKPYKHDSSYSEFGETIRRCKSKSVWSITLDEDLIEEILVCLPVKSLARCKCLSKKWNYLISGNLHFRQRYLDRCTDGELGRFLMLGLFVMDIDFPNIVRFVPTSTDGSRSALKKRLIRGLPAIRIDEELDFRDTHHPTYIVGCSNGFLLCSLEDKYPTDYLICNPITKQCIHLPTSDITSERVTHGFICHGTTPFLDSVQSYTVTRVIYPDFPRYTTTLTIEILSSDLPQQWKSFALQSPFPYRFDFDDHCLISENGVIYVTVHVLNVRCAFVFDRKTSTKSLQLLEFPVPPPPTRGGRVSQAFFGMSDGILVCTHWRDDHITIWLLDHKDGFDTTKQWSVEHSATLHLIEEVSYVMGCHPLNPLVLFIRGHNEAFFYDGKNSRLEVLCYPMWCYKVVPYTYGYGLVGRQN